MPNRKNRSGGKSRPAAACAAGAAYGGLHEEIAMLRESIRRVRDLLEADLETRDQLRLVEALSSACTRLAGLLKTQRALDADSSAALNDTLDQVIRDLGRGA